jgi:hypothetical protein
VVAYVVAQQPHPKQERPSCSAELTRIQQWGNATLKK